MAAPSGITAVPSPASLTLDPGETAEYTITFTTTPAGTLDEWAFGSITWSDGTHSVRSPIAVKPVALSAPDEVSGEGTSGSLEYDVTFGYAGPFNVGVNGLDAAAVDDGRTVVDDPADDINVALESGVGIDEVTVAVPAGTLHLRLSLFDENTDGEDDLDLYLFDPDGNFVDGSGGVTSAEQVDASNPAEGDWTLIVHGFETDGPDAVYDLFSWTVSPGADGNLTVNDPGDAVLGATETLTADWTGLTAGSRYLGVITYDAGGPEIDRTLISIDATE